jgi:tetratricopeptide (TPR) repeat protein
VFCRCYQETQFDLPRFEEQTRKLPVFPFPRSSEGAEGYRQAVELLDKHYVAERTHIDSINRRIVDFAIFLLEERYASGGLARSDALLCILYFHQGNNGKAKQYAGRAMRLAIDDWARQTNYPSTSFGSEPWTDLAREPGVWSSIADKGDSFALPAAVWAVASLADRDVQPDETTALLASSLAMEPNNPMMPMVISLYVSRLLQRSDIDPVHSLQRLVEAIGKQSDENQAMAAYSIIAMQSFALLKIDQTFISESSKVAANQLSHQQLARVYRQYNSLVALTNNIILKITKSGVLQKDTDISRQFDDLFKLGEQYLQDSPRLGEIVSAAR